MKNALGLVKHDLLVVGAGVGALFFIGLGVSGFQKSSRAYVPSAATAAHTLENTFVQDQKIPAGPSASRYVDLKTKLLRTPQENKEMRDLLGNSSIAETAIATLKRGTPSKNFAEVRYLLDALSGANSGLVQKQVEDFVFSREGEAADKIELYAKISKTNIYNAQIALSQKGVFK